jgi:hypothetical protein
VEHLPCRIHSQQDYRARFDDPNLHIQEIGTTIHERFVTQRRAITVISISDPNSRKEVRVKTNGARDHRFFETAELVTPCLASLTLRRFLVVIVVLDRFVVLSFIVLVVEILSDEHYRTIREG